MNNIALAVK